MFQVGSYDEVSMLADRVLAIDSENQEAIQYLKKIQEIEKDKDWVRLQRATDVRQFVKEYYHI